MKNSIRTALFLSIAIFFFFFHGFLSTSSTRLYGQTVISDSKLESLAKNFEYALGPSSKYRLKDGLYEEGKSMADYARIRLDSLATGDLNGDSLEELAVILASNFGGSGHFYMLTVLINKGDRFIQTNNLELGDRVNIQSLAISQGKISIEMLTHGPDDPMSSPSLKVKSSFQLDGDVLKETK